VREGTQDSDRIIALN